MRRRTVESKDNLDEDEENKDDDVGVRVAVSEPDYVFAETSSFAAVSPLASPLALRSSLSSEAPAQESLRASTVRPSVSRLWSMNEVIDDAEDELRLTVDMPSDPPPESAPAPEPAIEPADEDELRLTIDMPNDVKGDIGREGPGRLKKRQSKLQSMAAEQERRMSKDKLTFSRADEQSL